jgi:hypothetical protein
MLPSKFDRQNFTAARAASAFTCAVWFDPDQATAQYFHSWQDELFKLKHTNGKTLYLISHSRGFRTLQKMLDNFYNPMHRTFKPAGFCRAEIYENFGGNIVHARMQGAELDDAAMVKPVFRTDDNLKQPGRHRVLDSLETKSNGFFSIDRELMRSHMNANWHYWQLNSKYSEKVKV